MATEQAFCLTCDGRGWEVVDGVYPHDQPERQTCGACHGTGTEQALCYETFTAGDGEPAIRVTRQPPTCPLCGAFTRNHDDGCWSCSRCGADGDNGDHREAMHHGD